MCFDNVEGRKVCNFICNNSACDETCCMIRVLGECYSIASTWDEGGANNRADLLRVMKWRISHGERTMAEANKIGIYFNAKVV